MKPFLVAGGGIGGLACALAFALHGFRCRVLERRATFSEAGAGIQIGPNGVKALRALGVADALDVRAGKPSAISIHDGTSGRPLTQLPLGETIAARLGAPYWTAHRADLHAVLLEAARRDPRIAIETNFEVARLEATAAGVRVHGVTGASFEGAALIGADGLWSRVRGYVADRAQPRFAGRRAYRAVVMADDVPPSFNTGSTGLWLAPGAHVVHYPVRGGSEIALVVILATTAAGRGWDEAADRAILAAGIAPLHASLKPLLNQAHGWRSWALYDMPCLERWSNGGVVLLGDAAHPVLPFLAQGGVLALEDALTLASAVGLTPGSLETAVETYAKARRGRARAVARASRRNGAIYHLSGASAFARNTVLRTAPPASLLAQYDWLYGWQPPAPAPVA